MTILIYSSVHLKAQTCDAFIDYTFLTDSCHTDDCIASIAFTAKNTVEGELYCWNFGDGEATCRPDSTIIHTYTQTGFRQVFINILSTTQEDCSALIGIPVFKNNDSCNITFDSQNLENNTSLTFTSTNSFVPSTALYDWDFGDGTQSNATQSNNISHSYDIAGEYTLCVKAYQSAPDIIFCQECITLNIAEKVTSDTCGISYQPVTTDQDTLVNFNINNMNIPSDAIYDWNFGDGNFITALTSPQINHTYDTSGIYTITVRAYTNARNTPYCQSQRNIFIERPTVNTLDTCGINYSLMITENNISVAFSINRANIPIEAVYDWDFGDGNMLTASSSFNPTHTYTSTGEFAISVQAYSLDVDTTYCQSSKRILIPEEPIAETGFNINGNLFTDVSGTIWLYKKSTNAIWIPFESQTYAIKQKNFEINNIPAGEYIIHIIPEHSSNSRETPTFYPQQSNWKNAYIFNINSDIRGLSVRLNESPVFDNNQTGSIDGSIDEDILNNPDQYGENLMITLRSPSGIIINWKELEADSEYSFERLPLGQYTVNLESPGYPTISKKVVLNNTEDKITNKDFRTTDKISTLEGTPPTTISHYVSGNLLFLKQTVFSHAPRHIQFHDMKGKYLGKKIFDIDMVKNGYFQVTLHEFESGVLVCTVDGNEQKEKVRIKIINKYY